MTTDLIKFGYVAGEISPTFFGRPDLEKFDLALAECENWFVDYRGGVSTRPGQELIDYVKSDTLDTRWFSFKFSSDIEDTYAILAGNLYFRFVQDGGYVLETGQSITSITVASVATLTKAGHGYQNGDWIKIYNSVGMTGIEAQTFVVTNRTANTLELYFPTGQAFNTAALTAFTSGTMARIYTVVTPFAAADLETLQATQVRDLVRFTHPSYDIYNLTRNSHASWTLAIEDFTSPVARPTSVDASHSGGGGDWMTGYVVTAVDREGNESFASLMKIEPNLINPTVDAESIFVEWNHSGDVDYFNVYRTVFIYQPTGDMSFGNPVGYIGRAYGRHFQDNGIIPDFASTPPRDNNPFIDGAIDRVLILTDGSNYTANTTFTVSDPDGTGFIGQPIIAFEQGASTGDFAGVLIISRGSGYTNPSAVIGGGFGSGATFSFIVNELTGNHPACSAIFQQRQVYGATDNQPLTVFGSKPGRLSNFNSSEIVTSGDPFEHTIDADSMSPLRHLIPSQGGLLIFNEEGVWLLTSASGAVTPLDATADPKSFAGATILKPLRVDSDLLYVEGKGNVVRMLSFADITQERFYSGKDVSILANHLISKEAELSSWAYAPDPFHQVLGVRDDGLALAFTVLKEQEIYAWSRYKTRGWYDSVIAVQEGRIDSLYFIVRRYVNGRWTKFIERQVQRDFDTIEDAFCVDCGLALTPTEPAADIQLSAASGTATVVASASVFTAGDVGKILRVGGGKAEITAYTDGTHLTAVFVRAVTDLIPETTTPRLADEGTWTLDAKQTVLFGLYHLEGETVSILADGSVVDEAVVTNGKVTLAAGASRVAIGLGFTCKLKSLPINVPKDTVEHRRKRITGVAMRQLNSRGLEAGGYSYDKVYPFKERTDEPYGEPTEYQSGMKFVRVEPKFEEDVSLHVIESNPLPATLLGWVLETEIGDDPD